MYTVEGQGPAAVCSLGLGFRGFSNNQESIPLFVVSQVALRGFVKVNSTICRGQRKVDVRSKSLYILNPKPVNPKLLGLRERHQLHGASGRILA